MTKYRAINGDTLASYMPKQTAIDMVCFPIQEVLNRMLAMDSWHNFCATASANRLTGYFSHDGSRS
jgi:hypothetical protein